MIQHELPWMWVKLNNLYWDVAVVTLAAVFHTVCHITETLRPQFSCNFRLKQLVSITLHYITLHYITYIHRPIICTSRIECATCHVQLNCNMQSSHNNELQNYMKLIKTQ
jgi:hypothetical protein